MADPHLLFRLLLIFLGVSNVIFSNHVPSVTSRNLLVGQDQAFQTTFGETKIVAGAAEKAKLHGGGERRRKSRRRKVEMELNDYPGSGANNRHTPRQPFGRGCLDC